MVGDPRRAALGRPSTIQVVPGRNEPKVDLCNPFDLGLDLRAEVFGRRRLLGSGAAGAYRIGDE
jgi:hypothetical protein